MASGCSASENSRHLPPRIGTLLIPSDPYWIQALEAIMQTAQQMGDELVILQPVASIEELNAISPDDLVEQILAQNLDVLICTLNATSIYKILADEGLPLISLAETAFCHPKCIAISSLYPAGWLAGQYIGQRLSGKGHTLCVSAGLDQILVTPQSRLAGYQDAAATFPAIETVHIPAYWTYAQAYPAILAALDSVPHKIDAVFGISDTIILATRDAGRKLGLIDNHTILVGANGDPMALAAIVDGTLAATVDLSAEKLGARGVEMAHRVALGQPISSDIPQEFQLITHENVASFATQKLIAIAAIPTRMVGYNHQLAKERIAQLEISTEITRQISSLMDRDQMIKVISALVREHYGFQWMRVLRWSKENRALELYGGELSPAAQQVPIEKDFLLEQVYTSNETVFIPDIHTSFRWQMGKDWDPIRARAVLPIQLGEEVIGVLDLQSSDPMRQATMELIGLKLLASQVSIAIQNVDLFHAARQAQEAAERANQLKTRLMANVGHEMRTPLNAILGFSQAVAHKLDEGKLVETAELQQDVRHIYKSGEHLMYMINDLLDLSRAEIGALNLFFEPIQPSPFLKETFEEFAQSDLVPANIERVLDVPERLPIIQADTVRLRQILMNLLTNAGKFTQQGSILLGARVEIPYLHVWVQDTGQGVPIERQTHIFEPFQTTGRKRHPQGIGLGLSITRHLVELHDGMITLESQPGTGSTFHIYFPLPGVSQRPVRQAPVNSLPILLVMTSQAELPDEIRCICDSHNLIPHIINSRDDLNQAMAAGIPSAIAWDLANASSNAWSLIYRLNQNQKCAALPVILYGSGENGAQSNVGPTNIIFKPCSGNSIKDWIAQVDCNAEEEDPILIVDDDPDAREHYQQLVEKVYPRNPILLANDGLQALEILRCEVPALILLDLMMPEVDGFTVLKEVRSNPKTQHIPIVIISGKLLNFEDIQRLNFYKTVFYNKGILSDNEIADLIYQVEADENRLLPQPTSLIIKQGLAFMHQNYPQPISRKEIAGTVGVSENYFSQIFRHEMSLSPWDYLARLRVQKAKELLQTQHSITHIALMVGFNDPAYFSRVFHKITGQSPHEYRSSRRS